MKATTTFFAPILILALCACGKNNDNKSSDSNPVSQNQTAGNGLPQAKVEMPKVQYPAAIVFEGGKSDPGFADDNSKQTPAWRLYICLGKTAQPTTGQVTLDLAKLGSAIELTWLDPDSKETLYTERLNKVVLNYTYTTELSDDPANNYGYAYGKAAVDMQSQQSWEVVYAAPSEKNHTHQSYEDVDIFNVKTTNGTFTQFGEIKYPLNGETFYVSNGLDRFAYSEKDNRSHVVDACEKANQPFVLQVGNEITPIK